MVAVVVAVVPVAWAVAVCSSRLGMAPCLNLGACPLNGRTAAVSPTKKDSSMATHKKGPTQTTEDNCTTRSATNLVLQQHRKTG